MKGDLLFLFFYLNLNRKRPPSRKKQEIKSRAAALLKKKDILQKKSFLVTLLNVRQKRNDNLKKSNALSKRINELKLGYRARLIKRDPRHPTTFIAVPHKSILRTIELSSAPPKRRMRRKYKS